MRFDRSFAIAFAVGALIAGGAVAARASASNGLPPWVAADGHTDVSKLPPLIQMGSDLYPEGYVWLDTQAFKHPGVNGPYNVFAPGDKTKPIGWYYMGTGVVSIGVTEAQAQRVMGPVEATQVTISTVAP